MGRLSDRYRDRSLREAFILTVLVTFGTVVLLSGTVIWSCAAFRGWLLPDSNKVVLVVRGRDFQGNEQEFSANIYLDEKEMTPLNALLAENGAGESLDPSSFAAAVARIENSETGLTPKRRLAYQCCGILMIVFPVLLSIGGILFCGFSFYRHKLQLPLKALSEATEQIAGKNLDFVVTYEAEDELGRLCRSFEQMRRTLHENNRALWKMLEERKLLLASIAHDLRNPIAIIEGYTEYLRLHLHSGDLSWERVGDIAERIGQAAGRLEQYTESVRTLDQLEDLEIHREEIPAGKLLGDIAADLALMTSEKGKVLRVTNEVSSETPLSVDAPILYRVLENILNNALRYARETIELSFVLQGEELVISVADDGKGFGEALLRGKNILPVPAADAEGHRGMGLTVSRLLCRKHGGRLELANREPHGALVKIIFRV